MGQKLLLVCMLSRACTTRYVQGTDASLTQSKSLCLSPAILRTEQMAQRPDVTVVFGEATAKFGLAPGNKLRLSFVEGHFGLKPGSLQLDGRLEDRDAEGLSTLAFEAGSTMRATGELAAQGGHARTCLVCSCHPTHPFIVRE